MEVENSEFSAPIEVTQGAGNSFADVAVAEEHYVELRFGKEMRRRYKPGLPFSGKVRRRLAGNFGEFTDFCLLRWRP